MPYFKHSIYKRIGIIGVPILFYAIEEAQIGR